MAEIDNFVATPTVDAFEAFTKEKLVLLARHYAVSLSTSAKFEESNVDTFFHFI